MASASTTSAAARLGQGQKLARRRRASASRRTDNHRVGVICHPHQVAVIVIGLEHDGFEVGGVGGQGVLCRQDGDQPCPDAQRAARRQPGRLACVPWAAGDHLQPRPRSCLWAAAVGQGKCGSHRPGLFSKVWVRVGFRPMSATTSSPQRARPGCSTSVASWRKVTVQRRGEGCVAHHPAAVAKRCRWAGSMATTLWRSQALARAAATPVKGLLNPAPNRASITRSAPSSVSPKGRVRPPQRAALPRAAAVSGGPSSSTHTGQLRRRSMRATA